MRKPIPFSVAIGGMVLIAAGITGMNASGSAHALRPPDSPPAKTDWMPVAGAITALLGMAGLTFGARSATS